MALVRGGSAADTVLQHTLFRYLVIGGLSFVVDFGLLVACHELLDTPLWIATSAGFWGSLFFNFSLNKLVAFRAPRRTQVQLLRYAVLLGANYLATLLIVGAAAGAGLGYEVGKIVAVGCTTIWNYVLYRIWVFSPQGDPSR